MDKKEELNKFLVTSFNYLLQSEEKALENATDKKVSLKEIHLIEKISEGEVNKKNTAGDIAKELGITLGTLTVATNTLIEKGLIKREKIDVDKRIVRLVLTESGKKICSIHKNYHQKLVEDIVKELSDNEQKTLLNALSIVEKYFKVKGE